METLRYCVKIWANLMLVVLCVAPATLQAAAPPESVNYQGVLRDASGAPLNGSYVSRVTK